MYYHKRHRSRWKHALLLFVAPLLLIAPVVSLFATPEQASAALTPAEQKACYDKFNGKTLQPAEAAKEDYQKCKEENNCTSKLVNAELGSVKVTCKQPSSSGSAEPDPPATEAERKELQKKAARDVFYGKIKDVICPASMGSFRNECLSRTKAPAEKCINDNLSADFKIKADTATTCLSKLNSSVSPRVIKKTLTDAQAAATAAANAVPKVDEGGDDRSSCQVDGIGWIVCPVVNLLAKMTDQAYKIISSMLEVQAYTSTSGDAALRTAWGNMRSIANVAFVIAFLIIIYSQITGFGLSNYGIKRMLPRIIMAAILVNVSYWVCAVAVDLSNISGSSMNAIIQNAGGEGVASAGSAGASAFATAGGWEGVAGKIIAGTLVTAALYLALPALLTGLVAAAFAVFTVFLVLVLRQALIILLIVVAPLAFVAFLLPNTEGWFKKWLSLFSTLLLMFPIIGLIFGASALASNIVMNSAGGGQGAGDEGMKIALQVMGGLISILPLAITPVVMKTAGGVLNRFAGVVNNPNKGPFDALRKRAQQKGADIKTSRSLRAMDPNKRSIPGHRALLNYRNKRNTVSKGKADQLEELRREQIAQLAGGDTAAGQAFREKVVGSDPAQQAVYQARQQSYLASVNPEKLMLDADDAMLKAKVSELTLSVKDPTNKIGEMQKALRGAYDSGDVIAARAAQSILMDSGNKGRNALRSTIAGEDGGPSIDSTSEVGVEMRRDLQASNMKGSAADVYAWAVSGTKEVTNADGTKTTVARNFDEIAKDKSTWAGLSDTQAAGQVAGAMKEAVASGGFSKEKAEKVLTARGSENMGENEREILQDYVGKSSKAPDTSELSIPHGDYGSKPAASTNPAPSAAPAAAAAPSAAQTPAKPASNTGTPAAPPAGGSTNIGNAASGPASFTISHEDAARIGQAVAQNTKPASTTNNITSNNTTQNTTVNKPSSPGSVDNKGRYTPGGVQNGDDYHDRMQK